MSVQLIVVFISQVISIGFANNISVENLIDVDYESSDNTDRSLIVTKDGGPPVPTICMGELGCFPITPDFVHPKIRPINLTPWPRDKIKTRFMLYTETNPRDSYQLLAWNEKNLVLSGFDNRLPVKIIIPGWFDSRETTLWMQSMKDAFLQYTDVNVIIVEWTNLTPYMIAAANTRVVGAEVANVVNFLIEKTAIAAEQVHLIGHSLGAHIAGYAGQRVRHLGRITGLDPAKLMFQGMPASVTLDLTDANFVDIIHADPNVLGPVGYTESLGHIDFWPNGGSPQPGCFIRDRFFRGLEEGAELLSLSRIIRQSGGYGFLCSHQMAQKWFEKSIINGATGQCPFVGVKCANYQDFLNGQCSCDDGQDSCAVMGLPAEQLFFSGLSGQSAGSNWYLQTSLRQPFCFYQYQLVIKFKSDGHCYRGPGLLKLSFNYLSAYGNQDGSKQASLDINIGQMYSGLRMPYVMTTDEPMGDVYSVFVSWTPIDSNGEIYHAISHTSVVHLKYIRLSRIEASHGQATRPLTTFYRPDGHDNGILPLTSVLLNSDSHR